jgi:putative SOS response-associated peptidase YedK
MHAENFDSWLDPKTRGQEEALSDALTDYVGYPVSTNINNTRNDFPELLEPVAPPAPI